MSSNILITGSGKGIGRALAKKFAFSDETNSLILNSRTGSDLFSLSKELKTSKKKIDIYECDLSSKKDCIDLAEFSNQKKINFLINNAALPCPGLPLDKIPLDQIYKIIETNLIAPIILCKKIKGLENIVVLGTAHPFKFSDIVKKVTGKNLETPSHLKMDVNKKEKFEIIENSNSQVKKYILSKVQ